MSPRGELAQQQAPPRLVDSDRVAQSDGDAGVHPVGQVAGGGSAVEPPVLRPGRHPGQPVGGADRPQPVPYPLALRVRFGRRRAVDPVTPRPRDENDGGQQQHDVGQDGGAGGRPPQSSPVKRPRQDHRVREGHQGDHEQGERHDQPAVGMAGPAAPPSGGGDHRAEREPGRDAEQPFQVGEAAGDDQGERGIPDEQRAKPEPPSWGQRRGGGRRCTDKGGRHAQVAVVREAGGPVPPVPGSAEDQGHRSPDGDEVDDQAGHERASRTEAPLGEPATQHDPQQERHIGDRMVREEGSGDETPPVTRVHARRSVPHRLGERFTAGGSTARRSPPRARGRRPSTSR